MSRFLPILLPPVLLAGSGRASEPSLPAMPRITCALPIIDLGTVRRGSVVAHTFLLENRGTGPLHLESVHPSCDCTTAPLTERTLVPGKSLPLVVSLDTSQQSGRTEKTIHVLSDDPDRPVLQLEIRCTVLDLFQAVPARVKFQPISRNAEWLQVVELSRTDGKPLALQGVTVEGDPTFRARFIPKSEMGTGEVWLTHAPGSHPHTVDARLVVVTGDPVQPRLEIPITGQVVEDLGFSPARMEIGTVKAGDRVGPAIRITFHNPQTTLKAISCDPDLFTFEVLPRKEMPAPVPTGSPSPGSDPALSSARGLEIRLRVKPGSEAASVQGRILVQTTSRDQALIEIPLSGRIAGE